MKRLLALLTVFVLSCTCALAGTMTAPGSFPVVEGEPETLTILIEEDTLVSSYEDNAFTRYIEENCNVHIEFKYLPATDAASKLQVMVTSGETLPDVLCVTMGYTELESYAKSGAIIPLDDLYDEYSVNLKATAEAMPELKLIEQVTCSDGHIYALPRYIEELNNQFPFRMWICKTWLENLGLDMPTTTDELFDVLCAFRDEDANLNGNPDDEIPLAGANSGGTWWPTTFLLNSFVYTNRYSQYRYVEDGAVTVSYIQDGWKEGLKYLNKLYTEGLLDPATFTQTSTQLKAQTYNEGDTRMVGMFSVQNLAQVDQAYDYTGLLPLEGPEGVQYSVYSPNIAEGAWMISKDCKNPELAFRVGDFMFTEDAFLRCRVGEEGKSWVAAEEGSDSIFPDLYEATFVWLDNGAMWTNSQNSIWRQRGPLFAHNGLNSRANDDTVSYASATNNATIQALTQYRPDDSMILLFAPLTAEESKTINDIASTLYNFAEEYLVLFVTGELNIDAEWDNYLAELDNIGLQEYLAMYQNAYDRQN